MVVEISHHPGEHVRQRHIDFIHANWSRLASTAHRGYEKKGRGMLICHDEDFIDKPRGVMIGFRIVYAAKGTEAFQRVVDECLGEKELRWIKQYSPSGTILVGFIRTDGGFSSYRVAARVYEGAGGTEKHG